MSIAFLVLMCNFIIKNAKVLGTMSHLSRTLQFVLVIFLTPQSLFIWSLHLNVPGCLALSEVSPHQWLLCQRSKSGRRGQTKHITIMEPSAKGPSAYDIEKTGVQFHHVHYCQANWGEAIITLSFGGVAPLRFVWKPLLCLPFLAISDTSHRQEMDGDNGCILNGPSYHCVYS